MPPTTDAALALRANRRRNAEAPVGRRRRWKPARDALWALLDPLITSGAVVGVVGCGNGDDVPVRRIARRAGRLDLIDIDRVAGYRARRLIRSPRARARAQALSEDVTGGAADIAIWAALGGTQTSRAPAGSVVGGGDYDVLVGDLFYTQLVYPALVDAGLAEADVVRALERHGHRLTETVVRRLHASTAPGGVVVHVHDLLGYWDGHAQPIGLQELLDVAANDPEAAVRMAARGRQPVGADPVCALSSAGLESLSHAVWRWPFARGVDYLVCATVARDDGLKTGGDRRVCEPAPSTANHAGSIV